ncbi:hypothetical protein [Streptomyces triticagri]|uniref:hypothetical protein n=1 Tax=Streptomyces triticagri TaxID=2293568 RepID=UPI000FFB7A77|nr:hypothetical protein [Streptomyces triticagri]
MSSTPFRDTATKVARTSDYITMSVNCDRVRSHSWWKNVVEYGAWEGPGGARVGPPTPEAIDGIAKLFNTTADQVAVMVAADWYGVETDTHLSARMLSLTPVLDSLDEEDAELVETLARRLAR